MGVFSIATRADVRGRGSLATCRERWEHFPTKQLYSAVSEKPQLTLRMSKKHKTMQMDPKQQYSHTLLLRWPLWDTPNRGGPCGKTTHLSKERERHQDHMVEVLIRSWGCSTRLSWPHAHPPVHWGISCATWARSWPGNFSQVWILFRGSTSERGGQTRLVCFNSPVMSSCDKKKVLMYERYGVVFLLRWLSARQRVCSWFLRISSGMERDSSQVAEIQSSFSR